MVNLTINGEEIKVADGSSVLEAARQAGIDIPTMCSHADLTPYGACRLCLVEIRRNGISKITTSCNCPAEEGMTIQTDTERVVETRKVMADFMLSRCPEVPAVQRTAAALGVEKASFPADKQDEDCILCGLCVRACDEVAQEHVLGIVDRGVDRRVTTAFDVRQEVCDDCNQCIPYCPTGAITHLEAPQIGRRFKQEATRWKRARQVVQYAALAVFLGLMASTLLSQQQILPINIFSRLNPLQAITSMISSRTLIGTFLPVLLTVAVTLLFGRVWCGWFCPLGAVLELFGRTGRRIKAQGLRQLKYVVLFTVLVLAIFGSLAFMYFEPITILVRGLASIFKPVVEYVQLEDKSTFTIPGITWWLIGVPFLLVLGLNLIERRFWCRYLCPLGALVGLGSKFSWVKRRVNQMSCVQCGDCAELCTMGAISPDQDFTSDPAECIMCMDCAAPCPKTAITFERGDIQGWGYEFDPGRREALATLGIGAGAIGLLALDVGNVKAAKSSVLRPPGAQGEDFLSKCIRCDQCIEGCPNKALQPALFEAGWDAMWTPIFDPFSGSCDYDCNLCGQICPSGAIPNLSLEEKRKAVIGKVMVDQNACVGCMICQKVCPIEGSIQETRIEKNGEEQKLPHVDLSLCIGCGACVHDCPATGAMIIQPVDSV